MGQFPYQCPKCQGGYSRCGRPEEHLLITDPDNREVRWCEGGQFCWEDPLVMTIRGTNGKTYYLAGRYTGYGNVKMDKITIHSLEFEKHFKIWGDVDYIAQNFICQSCFEKTYDDESLSSLNQIINYIPIWTNMDSR